MKISDDDLDIAKSAIAFDSFRYDKIWFCIANVLIFTFLTLFIIETLSSKTMSTIVL